MWERGHQLRREWAAHDLIGTSYQEITIAHNASNRVALHLRESHTGGNMTRLLSLTMLALHRPNDIALVGHRGLPHYSGFYNVVFDLSLWVARSITKERASAIWDSSSATAGYRSTNPY